MNESQKRKVFSAITVAFCGGFILGDSCARKTIKSRLAKRKTLVANGLFSAVSKALTENLTQEQFKAELDQELEFLKIIDM